MGDNRFDGIIALQCWGIVQWRKIHIAFPFFKHIIGDQLALSKASAGHNAVTSSSDFIQTVNRTIRGVHQRVEHHLDAFSVRRTVEIEGYFFTIDCSFQKGTRQSDTFDAAGCQHAAVGHLIQFVFDGTGSAVDDENFH